MRDPEKVRQNARDTRARRIASIGKVGEARRQRNVYLRMAYGITLEQYEHMLAEQGGRCSICRREPLGIKPLHVDHNHTTGAVRGLLCRRCNSLVGFIEKHGALIPASENYLAKFKAN